MHYFSHKKKKFLAKIDYLELNPLWNNAVISVSFTCAKVHSLQKSI